MPKRKALSFIFLCSIAAKAFCANGVPLDVLRNDPYSMGGSAYAASEENRARAKEGIVDSYDASEDDAADAPQVFSNADNWPLWPWTVYDFVPDDGGESQPADTVISGKVPAAQAEEEPAAKARADTTARDELLKKTKRIHVDAYYAPAFAIPSADDLGIIAPYHIGFLLDAFDWIKFFQPLSFGGRFEISLAKILFAAGGFGADVTWSPVGVAGGVPANQFEANVFAALRFRVTSGFALTAQLGGGALMFFDSKAVSGTLSPVNPSLSGGVKLEWYLLPILAVSLNVRSTFPFLIVSGGWKNYPIIHADIGVGIHL